MPGCCPEGSYGKPPFPGYSWNAKGVVDQVGDMKVYRTGCSTKCIIWCYDIYGFEGGRTRQLCDQLADCGYMVIMPDFYRGEWRDVADLDLAGWLTKQSDWFGQRQAEWVETILPYARSQGAEVFGCVGTCWGGYMVMRLSAYGEFKAGVSLHPATTCIGEDLLNEKMYEVLDEVGCPQLVLTAGDDHSNEKPGGLAAKVWGVMSFGSDCVLREYPDMVHGWTVRGDMRDQAVGNAARAAFNSLKGFLDTHVK